jgi:flagellar basal-body rod modification protein FlgD
MMTINPIFQAHAAAPSNSSSSSSSGVSDDTFMQLLVAQLQNQSPLDPVDPNQFVNQLVQFNSLNELVSIHQLIQQYVGAGANSGPSNSSSQGAH